MCLLITNITPVRARSQGRAARHSGQRGMALITALIFLLVLTLLGITGMQSSTLEERMAGYAQDRERAFQAAEAALRDAGEYLLVVNLPAFNGSNGLYPVAEPGNPDVWKSVDWTNDSESRRIGEWTGGTNVTFAKLERQPRYVIEELPASSLGSGESLDASQPQISVMYRITAQGWGSSEHTVVQLQQVFQR